VGSAQAALSRFPPRPARWPFRGPADFTLMPPKDPEVRLAGTTENASLSGLLIRLPVALRPGSRVGVRIPGEPVQTADVRWHRSDGGAGVLHGLRLAGPVGRRTPLARPFRKLLWRQRMRRLWFALVGLAVMACAAYGLVWILEALRLYDPKFYEPKDVERQWHQRQQAVREERSAVR
jgi:hypothetical protein